MRPPAPKAGSDVHETTQITGFADSPAEVSANSSARTPETHHARPSDSLLRAILAGPQNVATEPASEPAADFGAALLLIDRLPLTDAEKTEVIRRLLAR